MQKRGGSFNLTIKEIVQKDCHKIVYAPLIINRVGYDKLSKDCSDLILTPAHIIGEEYNLFNKNCICWKQDIDLFNEGTDLILRKSNELKVPSTKGLSVNDEKGFHSQGLALAFEHGAPDAIPAFFYWRSENWVPLIKKVY